ncbi:glycosyltransferase [Noviherbaspirillum pedocola]|uniref:Glycosyltransferase n=1 Tax=Noviherbaspirillum pedocola TaxID=2801341 RepID=A0A934W6F3_9BURK|nr:glycosyltransferase [Noviherbaspirillum pedocola]MBK4734293.1 glycosyltransferase [Noviherbaspirillum pedocola]
MRLDERADSITSPLLRGASHQGAPRGLGADFANGLFSLFSSHGPSARLTILLFHKIPRIADPLTPDEPILAQFERTLDFLSGNANVLPLSEAVGALGKGTLPRRSIAITFDDGYDDWLHTVGPALRKRNLPATFFITTGQLEGPALWHERIIAAVRALPDTGSRLPYGFGNYSDLRSQQRRIKLIAELQERLKYAPLSERMAAIEMLEAQAISLPVWPVGFGRDAVRELHNQGFEIGGHTISHPILNECSDDEALQEIGGCKEELESIIGGKVHSFAYPNGRPVKDYEGRHVAMVKACGYRAAVATSGGAAKSSSDIFQLPRFTPWGESEERMALQLARNLVAAEKHVRSVPVISELQTQTPVRCLMIASTFAPLHGGSAVVYDNLCRHMPEGSIRVLTARKSYLTNREIEGWQEHDRAAPYPVERIPLLRPLMQPPPANILVSLWRFAVRDIPLYASTLIAAASIVRKHRINVICVGELVTGSWLGIALKRLFGCKLVIYIHGEEITTATGGRLSGNKRREYLHHADKVVAVSSFTCDALTQGMALHSEKIELIQNGVDIDRFTPGEKDPELIRRYGLEGKKVVLTLGRLVPRKGADMAIRAMAPLLKMRNDVHYLIVGDGELRDELKRIIGEEQVTDKVTLVGKVSEEDLVKYFRLCDIFLMPNRTMPDGDTEGFGLVFREANACGKPVIGGHAGGVVEAVLDGESGLLVDGNNTQEIGQAVQRLLGDEAFAAQIGKAGMALAISSSTKSVAARFLATCGRLLRD